MSAMHRETINVVAAADEGFAVGLAALVASVVEHRPSGPPLALYLFDSGLSPQSRMRLSTAFSSHEVSIFWRTLDKSLLIRCGISRPRRRVASYAPLVLDVLLPQQIDRVLFLDADTLILSDLTPLWETPLAGKLLGAVQDTMIHRLRNDYLPYEFSSAACMPVFNSGVMLVDLAKWRQEAVCTRTRYVAKRFGDRSWSVDQQVLNFVLAGRWHPLSLLWNRMTHMLDIPSYRCTPFGRVEFELALQSPRIIHFAGKQKPWLVGCRDDRLPEFFRQIDRTPWAAWRPERPTRPDQILEACIRYPHRRYSFVRRGLRVARQEKLATWPWWLSAASIALRFPWSPITFAVRLLRAAYVRRRLRGR